MTHNDQKIKEIAEEIATNMDGRTVTSHEHYREMLTKELEFHMKKYTEYILQQAIECVPELEPHICRFNDGECKCECYEACRQQTFINLKKLSTNEFTS